MIAISATSAIWVFRYIVKFAQIKTHFQIQCNIGKVMLIKIIVNYSYSVLINEHISAKKHYETSLPLKNVVFEH